MYVSTWSYVKHFLQKGRKKRGLLLDQNPVPHARTLLLDPYQECLGHRRIVQRFKNIGFDQARSQQQFSLFLYIKSTTTSLILLLLLLALRRHHPSCIPQTLHIRCCLLTTGPLFLTHPRLLPSPTPSSTSLLTYLGSIYTMGGLMHVWAILRNRPAR